MRNLVIVFGLLFSSFLFSQSKDDKPKSIFNVEINGAKTVVKEGEDFKLDGKIIKISQSSLVIEDVAGVEKVILLDGNTVIKKLRDDIKISNLLVDDSVVVIGSSNDKSEITAKLIRVMPAGFGHEPSKIIRMKNDRKYN